MNIRDEEQLQQYFERQMTGAQEQNFLINVAARDDMRIAFRSQLELLKAVHEDKDSSGSPTFVRTKTLTALGLGGALVPSSLKEHEEAQSANVISSSVWRTIGSAFRRPLISITAGLLLGTLGTMYFQTAQVSELHNRGTAPQTNVSIPPVIHSEVVPQAPITATQLKNHSRRPSRTIAKTNNYVPRISGKDNMPVINNTKPGTVGVQNTMHKPEDPGAK